MENHYIYLIHTREFINSIKKIYKVGKTTQEPTKRIKQYPKGSKILLITNCIDCHKDEKEILKLFKRKYIQRKDIGNEYFEGDYNEMITDINQIVKSGEIVLSDESDESDESEQIIVINSYKDFNENTNKDITIIITDKKKQSGFIKFNDNNLWHIIYPYDSEDPEFLLGWLKHYIENNNKFSNTMYNVEYHVDYNKLIKDVCKECFKEDFKIYQLKYNEFLIGASSNEIDNRYFILNTETVIFKNCNEYTDITFRYIDKSTSPLILNNNINTKIVDEILSTLVSNKKIIQYFKKLCYSVLVKESNETIIFEDYDICRLSIYLRDLLDIISTPNHPNGGRYIVYDESCKKDYIKEFKKIRPRIVYIENIYSEKELNDIKYFLKKLEIINIVILHRKIKINTYNFENFIEYINIHKVRISNSFPCDDDFHKLDNDIFYTRRWLFNNFLKWCCIKD